MSEPVWLSRSLVLAVHGRLLAEHGGPMGLRDEGLLESALASPPNHYRYEDADVFRLAAAYAHAIMSNHPFLDGNKRTGFTCAGVFLALNGHRLAASESDAVRAVTALARGDIGAVEFAQWLRWESEPQS